MLEKAEWTELEDGEKGTVTPPVDANSVKALQIDPKAERRIVRKIDMFVLPCLFIFYMLCFLDRTNIGNANVAGLSKDLGLVGYQYNVALLLFYICYSFIEIPSNLVLRKVGANIWVPVLMLAFGLITTLTAFVHSFRDLLGVRIALGIAEGGMMPACLVILGRFYTKKELVFRTALYGTSGTISGMIGGLLAYGLLQTKISVAPSWRAIFFIEGIISMGLGVIAFFVLSDRPSTAKFFTAEEKLLATERIRREQAGAVVLVEAATKAKLVLQGFKNLNTFMCAFGFATNSLSLQGLALFIPTIIKAINPNFTAIETQLKTVPVYAAALAVALTVSFASYHFNRRAYAIMFVNIFAVCGYSIFLGSATTSVNLRYGAVFLCAMGIFTPGPIWLSWGIANAGLDQMKAVAAGLVVGIGAFGSVVAVWSYLSWDAPRYMIGNSVNLTAVLLNQLLALGLMLRNRRENRLRDHAGRDDCLTGKTSEEVQTMGHHHPEFRYVW